MFIRHMVLVSIGAVIGVGCNGALVEEGRSGDVQPSGHEQRSPSAAQAPADQGPPDQGSPAVPQPTPTEASKVIPAGKELSVAGACASRTALAGSVGGGGGIRCQVSNRMTEPSTGYHSIEKVNGDRGDAEVKENTLLLRCASEGKMLFQAAVRCFEGDGDYTIAAGDLVLGGESSDRACRLLVDVTADAVRGFISCPNEPADPDNVFASSGAPIGLGAFDLQRSF